MTNQDLQSYLQASRGQQLMNAPAISPGQYGAFQPQPLRLGMTPEQLQAGLQQANYAPIADVPVAAVPITAPQAEPVAAAQEAPKMYPYDAYEAARKKQMETVANGYQSASKYASMLPSGQAEAYMSGFKNYVENAFPKTPEFKDTPEGELVKTSAQALQKRTEIIDTIKAELEAAQKIDNKVDKVRRLQTILPKLIQSAASGGSDAMQLGEFLIGAPEITNFSTYANANKVKGLFNTASEFTNYLYNPATKVSEAFASNPDAYIQKAMSAYNSIASSVNKPITRMVESTSPEYVKKAAGVEVLPLFPETEPTIIRPEAQQYKMTPTFGVAPSGAVRRKS